MSAFDDYEDEQIFGCFEGAADSENIICTKCGSTNVEWRLNRNGKWQLFSTIRDDHNRKVPHTCNPTTADDFEVLK